MEIILSKVKNLVILRIIQIFLNLIWFKKGIQNVDEISKNVYIKFETYHRDKFYKENMEKNIEGSRPELDDLNEM